MTYAIIPWERFNDFFPIKSSFRLVSVVVYFKQVVDINYCSVNFYTCRVHIGCIKSPRGGGSDSFIVWIVRMHAFMLSPTQIMSHYPPPPAKRMKDNTTLFPTCVGDYSLKTHQNFLEGSARGSTKKHVVYMSK